jgi:hypothetical protein
MVLIVPLFADNTPIGEISSDGDVYRTGTYPALSWQINHNPTSILDWVLITEDGKIVTRADVTVRVRVLAADVQELTKHFDGSDYVEGSRYVEAGAYSSVESSNWREMFTGKQPLVDPTEIVWEQDLKENDELTFAARANFTGMKWHYSVQNEETVIILKDGQTPPVLASWSSQTTLGEHIEPYLDEDGKIDLGPRDIIVAFELTGDPKNNNGHGNNADGYDSSNKGKKPGVDLSGEFDDENNAITSGEGVDPIDFQDMVILLTFEAS